MNKKMILTFSLIFILLFNFFGIKSLAYVLNGYKISIPKSGTFYLSNSLAQNATTVNDSVLQWNYGVKVKLAVNINNPDITLQANYSLDNGNYAVCSHNSTYKSTITFYSAFSKASLIVQKETAVHEVGHSLGLAHCQTAKDDISVMRTSGFNGLAYPLSDDIEGINAIY